MGVGGKFWDLLKPYARHEGPDYLREKRVAVDLSYWIVQHETAIKATHVRKPHLRLTFFRTINLFSRFGAFPVFVVDGNPSPLKSKARIARFFRASGIPISDLPVAEEGVSVERNRTFLKYVEECVELLELFGMPVVKAKGEAEALCAQLNAEGHVDACITADSDAVLFGALCVIKCLKPNSKEPFECYHISDIEAGLGLKKKHLIAISLLVGNDHDLNGVQGIGLETALRFVRTFSEDRILDGLYEIGNGNTPLFHSRSNFIDDLMLTPDERPAQSKTSHCSFCGHPGNKKEHFKSSCGYCGTSNGQGCTRKPEGFKCNCSPCDKNRKEKEQKRNENWHIKVCNKISMEPNFPNADIIAMYTCKNHASFTGDDPCLSWKSPDTDMLVDFLVFHQLWEPSYVRQRLLPMLSTIYLREMASKPERTLLYGQYVFDSIQRVKIRYGHQSYVIKWKKAAGTVSSSIHTNLVDESERPQVEIIEIDESFDQVDEENAPQIHVDDGGCFLLTDEDMDLVRGAFPEEEERFLHEKELKESKRRKCSSLKTKDSNDKSESLKSKGVQLSIKEFYRSSKVEFPAQREDLGNTSENRDDETPKEERKVSRSNLSKAVLVHSSKDGTSSSDLESWSSAYMAALTENVILSIHKDGSTCHEWIGSSHWRSELYKSFLNQKHKKTGSVASVGISESNTNSFPIGVSVLVVDCDSTCLRIVSKMLQTFGYKVTTATEATDALRILREKEDEVDLILTEAHLPDMDQYEILETVGKMSPLPIVIFSADNNENAVLGGLFKGAVLYLIKPIIKSDVKNLWQFTYARKMKTKKTVSSEGSNSFNVGSEENASSETVESQLSIVGQIAQKGKRKELDKTDKSDEDNDNLTIPKKPKLIWTNDLHDRFLQAIRMLGIDGAHPKKILQHMKVPGLKKENISSHLQKYRLSLKREQEAMQKCMIRDHHASFSFNLQGELCQFPDLQLFTTTSQSEYRDDFQNLCSPMSLPSLGSTQFPQVNTNHSDVPICDYGQVALESNQLCSTCTVSSDIGMWTTTKRNFASFGRMGSLNVEEHLQQGTTFSSVGTPGPTFLGNPQLQPQFSPLSQTLPHKEGEFDGFDPEKMEIDELLEMAKEFLEDNPNDLW